MPTQNPRLNVVLEKPVYQSLVKLAKRDGLSLSLKARDLICEALQTQEDLYWDQKADARTKTLKGRKAVTHEEFWDSVQEVSA